MTAKKHRCICTLEKINFQDLSVSVQNRKQSVVDVVKGLVLEELERREDVYFSQLADVRYSLESAVNLLDEFLDL